MGVRCTVTTWPCPPQVEQVEAVVPAFTPLPVHTPHSSSLLTLMSFLQIIDRPAQVGLSNMLNHGLGSDTSVWCSNNLGRPAVSVQVCRCR